MAAVTGRGPSLWAQALDSLDPKLKDALGVAALSPTAQANGTVQPQQSSYRDILRGLSKLAENEKDKSLAKSLKIRIRGKDLLVNDLVTKMVRWVEMFLVVGDTVVQYDPVHAALPWAGVRFLLIIALNSSYNSEYFVEGLEKVARLMTETALVEELYLQAQTDAARRLEEAVLVLYAALLQFLGKATKFWRKNLLRRMVASFTSKYDNLMACITRAADEVHGLLIIVGHEASTRGAKDMKVLLEEIHRPFLRQVQMQDAFEKTQRYHDILRWISTFDHDQCHHDVCTKPTKRIDNTGQWLLEHPTYKDWLDSSSSTVLILHGIPGCGKSKLASAVIDSLTQRPQTSGSNTQAQAAPVAHFYCSSLKSDKSRSEADEILRSLLRQVAVVSKPDESVHSAVVQQYLQKETWAKQEGFDLRPLTCEDCVPLLTEIGHATPLIFIIDAVDEICQDDSQRYRCIDALEKVRKGASSVVKIFATTRSDSNVLAMWNAPEVQRFQLQPQDCAGDMVAFVEAQVRLAKSSLRLLNGAVDDSLFKEIVEALRQNAGEMFLWVYLLVNELCRQKTKEDVKNAIRTMSSMELVKLYDSFYSQILNRGAEANRIAFECLSWLLCSYEPVSVERLSKLLSTASRHGSNGFLTEQMLEDLCCNLIAINTDTGVVRFSHFSVQSYLEEKPEFASPRAHARAAIACANTCMSYTPVDLTNGLLLAEDHLHYSNVYWGSHFRAAASVNDDALKSRMDRALIEFVFEEPDEEEREDDEVSGEFRRWLHDADRCAAKLRADHHLIDHLNAVKSLTNTPFFAACLFDLIAVIDELQKIQGYDWDQRNDQGHTGLYLASFGGNLSTAQRLVERSDTINTRCGSHGYPLHVACFHGYSDVVEFLVGHGADMSLEGAVPTALDEAILGGHGDSVGCLLLQHRRGVVTTADAYHRLASLAAQAGSTLFLELLEKTYGSQFGGTSSQLRKNAIKKAMLEGRFDKIERQLTDPSCDEELKYHALTAAIYHARLALVEALLDQGLDTEREGLLGRPLRVASLVGNESIVRSLLDRNADINASGEFGTALQAAAMAGRVNVVRLLLARGADVHAEGGYFGNALQAAAFHGHKEVVALLVQHAARPEQPGTWKTAMRAAAAGGRRDVLELFMQHGYELVFTATSPRMAAVKARVYVERNLLRAVSPGRRQDVEAARERDDDSVIWPGWHVGEPEMSALWKLDDLGVMLDSDGLAVKDRTSRLKDCWYSSMGYDVSEASDDASQGATVPEDDCDQGASSGVVVSVVSGRSKAAGHDLSSALRAAAEHGQIETLQSLLLSLSESNPIARPSKKLAWLERALEAAAARGQVDAVLEIGRFVNEHVGGGQTDWERIALEATCKSARPGALRLLLSRCQVTDVRVFRRVALECLKGDEDGISCMQTLLAHFGPQAMDQKLLDRVLCQCDESMVRFLLDNTSLPEGEVLGLALKHAQELVGLDFIFGTPEYKLGRMRALVARLERSELRVAALNACLCSAARNGHTEMVVFLLSRGADANGFVESYLSRYNEKVQMTAVQSCLAGLTPNEWAGAEHSERREEQDRPLLEILRLLVDAGADLALHGSSTECPLLYSVRHCPLEAVVVILEKLTPLSPNQQLAERLLIAAAGREFESCAVLQKLLDAGFEMPFEPHVKRQALDTALKFFETDHVGDVRHRDKKPPNRFYVVQDLSDVLNAGPGGTVRLMLSAMPNEAADNPAFVHIMQMAAFAGDEEYVQLLLDHGANVNASGFYYGSALQAAARGSQVHIAQLLLKHGAHVDVLAGAHDTALRAAVVPQHVELVRLLIDHKASVNLQQPGSPAILELAMDDRGRPRHPDMFAMLLHHGADPSAFSGTRSSPLWLAAANGALATCQLLIDAGPCVNGCNAASQELHKTPLAIASFRGYIQVAQLLLAHGALVLVPPHSNALASACLGGSQAMFDLISTHLVDTQEESRVFEHALALARSSDAWRVGGKLRMRRLLRGKLRLSSDGVRDDEHVVAGAKGGALDAENESAHSGDEDEGEETDSSGDGPVARRRHSSSRKETYRWINWGGMRVKLRPSTRGGSFGRWR